MTEPDVTDYEASGSAAPVRVLILASNAAERSNLQAMLAEVGSRGIEVDDAALAGADAELTLVGIDVVVVAGEESLEDAAHVLDDSGALVLLSGSEAALERVREMHLRGWGVLPEDAASEELGAAVLAAANGLAVMPAALTVEPQEAPATVEEPDEALTPREGEILNLLAAGMSNKMISHDLRISEHTVKFHISSLYAKLSVGNRAGAVSQGARRGFISL